MKLRDKLKLMAESDRKNQANIDAYSETLKGGFQPSKRKAKRTKSKRKNRKE